MLDVNEFDSMRIGLASPEQILEWSHGEVKNVMVYFANAFLDQQRTGNVTAVNINASAIKALSAINVA